MAKAGRPKGVANKPDPIGDMIKEKMPTRGGREKGRASQEFQGHKFVSSLKLDAVTHTVLKLQAMRRDVPMATLISDIINEWLRLSTDYNQSLFREILPRGMKAARVPERWAGYLASLGFVESEPQAPAIPAPIPLPPRPSRPHRPRRKSPAWRT